MKRKILYCDFWGDPLVVYLTAEEKLFYNYLLTNSHISRCGIYQLSPKEIIFETNLDRIKVSEMIRRFGTTYNKIMYNYDTNEIAIKNWLKYTNLETDKMKSLVREDISKVRDKSLIHYIKI